MDLFMKKNRLYISLILTSVILALSVTKSIIASSFNFEFSQDLGSHEYDQMSHSFLSEQKFNFTPLHRKSLKTVSLLHTSMPIRHEVQGIVSEHTSELNLSSASETSLILSTPNLGIQYTGYSYTDAFQIAAGYKSYGILNLPLSIGVGHSVFVAGHVFFARSTNIEANSSLNLAGVLTLLGLGNSWHQSAYTPPLSSGLTNHKNSWRQRYYYWGLGMPLSSSLQISLYQKVSPQRKSVNIRLSLLN